MSWYTAHASIFLASDCHLLILQMLLSLQPSRLPDTIPSDNMNLAGMFSCRTDVDN